MTKGVRNWLVGVYTMVLLMVVVGGITRLTGSGLSMVEWRPLMGAIPPIGDAEWQAVFALYQQSPQYEHVNSWMTLDDFQSIFLWEYLHRLLGRLIGGVFFFPWLYFVVKKQFTTRQAKQTAVLFALGGLQGLMGWYMVKSGLVDRPEVSHFRLAAHLCLALLISQGCVWIVLSSRTPDEQNGAPSMLRWGALGFLALVSLQIVYGAFMAGTRAGFLSATFPKMNGQWLPDAAVSGLGLWHDLFSNAWMIHFVHRSLGWLVFIGGLAFAFALFRAGRRRGATVLGGVLGFQFLLGILTVALHVSVPVAVMHQFGAVLLLSVAVYLVHQLRS